ncbi:Pyrimidine-nucleoside phosphorylase [subsurface metagenome]
MRAVDLIMKKRDGQVLDREEIDFLITGYVTGKIPDYQISSLAMAVFFKGMTFEETGFLTRAMINSGDIIDLSDIEGMLIDKHSTGGVGDKVSLILAPLAAACGLKVPMMSGRALGHTGGTLDKLESIPGYRTNLSPAEFKEALEKIGFAMIGQSKSVVPADRKLYALRDVTATVESIPLITASIMSKKFAEGAESFVFDVKCGSGAFMKTLEQAEELAISLVETGRSLNRKIKAVISDMDQPLGLMIGNFPEVREVVSCLHNQGPRDLMDLTIRLTAWMVVLGGLAADISTAEKLCREKIIDGSAWKKFLENVEYQGGDIEVLLNPYRGPGAQYIIPLKAENEGFLKRIDAYKMGLASVMLGAGRSRKEDPVFPAVGIELLKVQGDAVMLGEELCLIHGEDLSKIDEVEKLLKDSYSFNKEPLPPGGRVLKEL